MAGNPPPAPMGLGVLKVHKNMHNLWVAAGGAPIYGPVTPPAPGVITINPITSPATSPVQVFGTISPGGAVDGAVFQGATLVVPWSPAAGTSGNFGASIPIPTGAGYTVRVRQRNLPTNIQTSNTFDVE